MKETFDGLVEHLLAGNIFLEEAIEVLERRMIERALERTGGNRSEASKQLGIHRNTLQRKLAEYQIGENGARPRRRPPAHQVRSRKPKSGAA